MKIRMVRPHGRTHDTLILKETQFEARVFKWGITHPLSYQIIGEGPHCGEEIPWESCMELPEEKKYSEEEYNQIVKDRDVLEAKLEDALADLASYGYKLAVLEKQNKCFLPVIIPKDVADAIDSYKGRGLDVNHIVRQIARTATMTDTKFIIKQFAAENGHTFISVLLHGYRVAEETEGEKTERKLISALVDMDVTCPVPLGRLAKVLSQAIKEPEKTD